jgi:uncharacterized RDD family membrane protein YckC
MGKTRIRDVKRSKIKDIKKNIKNNQIDKIVYASIGDRIKAFLTDLFMLLMPFMYFVVYLIMGSREEFETNMSMGWIYILIPNFLLVVTFLFKKGQTPGCKAYNIKLIDTHTKEKASLFSIILRYYIELLSFVTILGIFIPYFRKDKKSLQDIISATHFIKIDR